MNYLNRKLMLLVIASLLTMTTISSVVAAVAISNKSVNSLSISSTRSENNYHYLLEIRIKGISTSKVTFITDYQSLYLSAQSGGVISDNAIVGAQVISLIFDFPANANLNKYMRVHQANKILIRVPKRA